MQMKPTDHAGANWQRTMEYKYYQHEFLAMFLRHSLRSTIKYDYDSGLDLTV